jgi:hypothetical protein
MKVRGYPVIKRHALAGSGERQFTGSGSERGSEREVGSFNTNGVERLLGAPSMPIPADHPLALRYRAIRPTIIDVTSWKQAIQVGSAEIAVA